MKLADLLQLEPGITAVIGGGGKTTLLKTLSRELQDGVILCTTTHIYPFEGLPLYTGGDPAGIRELLKERGCICLGRQGEEGKLCAPALPMTQLARLGRFILVEADGSKGLPLKAHAPHEPVIPPDSRNVIWVTGASGFGRPVKDAVHRWEIFCRMTGAHPQTPVSPELAAAVIRKEGLATRVFLNQVETREDWALAEAFAGALAGTGIRMAAGSLRLGQFRRL